MKRKNMILKIREIFEQNLFEPINEETRFRISKEFIALNDGWTLDNFTALILDDGEPRIVHRWDYMQGEAFVVTFSAQGIEVMFESDPILALNSFRNRLTFKSTTV